MELYGSDKPDIRFGMTFNDITSLAQGKGFGVFDSAEYIGAICAEGCATYTRKQLDELTEFVKRPQIGAKGKMCIRDRRSMRHWPARDTCSRLLALWIRAVRILVIAVH